jgi:hypothetical protein
MQPETPTTTDPPLPPRLRWFAPWGWFQHWKPWKRWTLFVAVALIGYVLSYGPAFYFVLLTQSPAVHDAYLTVYAPVSWCSDRCEPLQNFYFAQWRWLAENAFHSDE